MTDQEKQIPLDCLKDRLIKGGWVHLNNNKWVRKNSFIDMADGSNSCSFEDALIVQDFIDELDEEKNES